MFAGRIAVTVSFVLAERIFPCHTSTSLFTSQSRAGSRAHQVKDEGAESCFFFFFLVQTERLSERTVSYTSLRGSSPESPRVRIRAASTASAALSAQRLPLSLSPSLSPSVPPLCFLSPLS